MQEMQETQVWYLCWEDSLEKEMASYFSILARGAWQATVHGSAMSWTWLSNWTHTQLLIYLSQLSFSSVQFSYSVMSDSSQPHGLQHTRLPCPSPTPVACSNSCPLSWWCHPTIWSSAILFSSSLQSFPASGSYPITPFFISGGQSNESFSFSVSPSNEYSGLISFRMNWLYLLAVQGTLKSLLQHHSSKVSILRCSAFFIVQFSHPYKTNRKTTALTRWTLSAKECLCFLKYYLGWS